ncbi:MAG TPA: YhjD/YihY/BrkB family envelope integrity protein [bacterium]
MQKNKFIEIAEKVVDLFLIKDIVDIKGIRRFWIKWTRIFAIAVREFLRHKCALQASALTYVTLVSIVPVLAFTFAIGKGLGFHENLKEFLMNHIISAIGTESQEISDKVSLALGRMFEYIEKTNFQTLGAIGVVVLIYLVIRMLGNIEDAFNDIWGVSTQRSIYRKFSDYLSVVIIFPFFVLISATGTAMLASDNFQQILLNLGGAAIILKIALRLTPYFLLWFAFSALYIFMPNTKVKLSSAIAGGLTGGTLWQIMQWIYFHFQVNISQYNAIYSTVAALPIFLIWLYLSWVVMLFGAEVAYGYQMVKSYRFRERINAYGMRTAEILALSIVWLIAKNFIDGKKPIELSQLSDIFGIKSDVIRVVIDALIKKEIISNTGSNDGTYLLTVSPDKILTLDVINAVSGKTEADLRFISPAVFKFYKETEQVLSEKYKDHTIASFIKDS